MILLISSSKLDVNLILTLLGTENQEVTREDLKRASFNIDHLITL